VILANTESTPSSPARAANQLSSPAQPASRPDGGPEEGTAGPFAPAASSTRYDGGPEEGTRGPGH
jgi:hypothetical protein